MRNVGGLMFVMKNYYAQSTKEGSMHVYTTIFAIPTYYKVAIKHTLSVKHIAHFFLLLIITSTSCMVTNLMLRLIKNNALFL